MANILQVTSPSVNTNRNIIDTQGVKNETGPQIQNPVDPTRVVRADGQTGGRTGTATGEGTYSIIDYESNYGTMRRLLLEEVGMPDEYVHPIYGVNCPEIEAKNYSTLVCRTVPLLGGFPAFDVVLLGAGDDGHTSSIFPGQEDLLTSNDIYVLSTHPRNGQKRIAMTGYPILNARHVIFLITGKSKADVVEEICNSGDTGPAAYIAHHAQNVELFMDKGAALYIDDLNKKDLN